MRTAVEGTQPTSRAAALRDLPAATFRSTRQRTLSSASRVLRSSRRAVEQSRSAASPAALEDFPRGQLHLDELRFLSCEVKELSGRSHLPSRCFKPLLLRRIHETVPHCRDHVRRCLGIPLVRNL